MKTVLFIKHYHGVIQEGTKANVTDGDFSEWLTLGIVQELEFDGSAGVYIKSVADLQISRQHKENYMKAKFIFAETFKEEKQEEKRCEIVSNYIVDEYKLKTIRDSKGDEFWYEQNGVYTPNGRTVIIETAYDFFGKHLNSTLVNRIEILSKAKTYVEPAVFFGNVDRKRVGVANGILNLETYSLESFKVTGQGNIFVRIPIIYDETKSCPHYESFIKGILEKPEQINAIQELLGFCLLPNYDFEKIFIFTGKGRNGKSKLISLIKTLLGAHNCTGHSLQTLQNKDFAVAELHNKLANIGGDISSDALKQTDIVKQITGQDLITANRKFKDYVSFVSFAKQIFACNELPMIYDNSLGFWNRINRIDFPYTFYEKSELSKLNEEQMKYARLRDEKILDNIVTADELSGLLNYALIGLEMLRKTKEFSNAQDTADTRSQWLRKTSSFYAYICDMYDFDAKAMVTSDHVTELYDMYCQQLGLELIPPNQRASQVRSFSGKVVSVIEKRIEGEKYRIWKGIKLKEKYDNMLKTFSQSLLSFNSVQPVIPIQSVFEKMDFEKISLSVRESDGTDRTGGTADE